MDFDLRQSTTQLQATLDNASPYVETSQPVGGMLQNVLYNLGTLTGSVTFTLASPVQGLIDHYYWTFDTGSTEPTVTWPTITQWTGDNIDSVTGYPIVSASKHYEVSVFGGYGRVNEF